MRVQEYLEANWYIWLPTFVVVVVTPWIFTSLNGHNDRLTRTETKVDFIEKLNSENKSDIKDLTSKLNEHDLSIREIQIKTSVKASRK
jgi:hypothetical protein